MKIIDNELIDRVVEQAKESPRLRMNYNFHPSLDDKCHRLLNALEPGSVIFEVKEGPFVAHEVDGILHV